MRDEERAEPALGARVDRAERLRRRTGFERDELGGLLEADERVGEPVRGVAEAGGEPVGGELPLRREEQVNARRGDRPEHEEERALEDAADPARLEEDRRRDG